MASKAKVKATTFDTPQARAALAQEGTQTYYLYDDNVQGNLAGHPIQSRDKERFVILTPVQAQYYIDQGTIGPESMADRGKRAQAVQQQTLGQQAAAPKK